MAISDRLRQIKGSRAVARWERDAGIGSSNLHRALKEDQLNDENIRVLCYYENASSEWIISGRGNPYRVIRCDTDLDFSEQIEAYNTDEENWTLTVILRKSDNLPCAVVLTMPSRYPVKQRGKPEPLMVDYTALEVMVGPIGPSSSEAIKRDGWGKRQQLTLADEVVESLCKGGIGTYALMQEPGYLKVAVPLDDKTLADFASTSVTDSSTPGYTVPLTPHEQRLLKTYRAMATEDRERLLAIADTLKGFSA
jgi:hypothetical protein